MICASLLKQGCQIYGLRAVFSPRSHFLQPTGLPDELAIWGQGDWGLPQNSGLQAPLGRAFGGRVLSNIPANTAPLVSPQFVLPLSRFDPQDMLAGSQQKSVRKIIFKYLKS